MADDSTTESARKSFESWALGPAGDWTPRAVAQRVDEGYGNPQLNKEWESWKAAQAVLLANSQEAVALVQHTGLDAAGNLAEAAVHTLHNIALENFPHGTLLYLGPQPKPNHAHTDAAANDGFLTLMENRLALDQTRNPVFWSNPAQSTVGMLAAKLCNDVLAGDPVNIANTARMIYQRGGTAIDIVEALAVFMAKNQPYALTPEELEATLTETVPSAAVIPDVQPCDVSGTKLYRRQGATQPAYQARVAAWMDACFGKTISADRVERNNRFLEESLELVQAGGSTASDAHSLVDYVFGRPVGEISQEVGGVMVTLAALCQAHGVDMAADGDIELRRNWTKISAIRAKQASKPNGSPLPQAV